MKVAVLDHGMGNLRSVAKALEVAGADVRVTSSPDEIGRSDALCVPGQGVFGRCMTALDTTDTGPVIREWVEGGRPYLGICLGMQVLFEGSEEDPRASGLGLLRGRARKLPKGVVIPHIGWNTVGGEHYYFDHSYAVHPSDESIVAGWCEHGERFAAWVKSGSITAVQFHPEKSGEVGIELLRDWVQAA